MRPYFWRCFFLINAICIGGVVAQDKFTTVPIVPSEKFETPPAKRLSDKKSPLLPPDKFIYVSKEYKLLVEDVQNPNAHCKKIFESLGYSTQMRAGLYIAACSEKMITKEGKYIACLVYLPPKEVVGPVRHAALYIHELAHCNGWVHE